MEIQDFLTQAAHVVPDANQLSMLRDNPFYMFVHFGTNTFTDLEWGDGTASPDVFNPKNLDCEQWCKAAISAGMKGIVLTAKHHDGFCLWQTKYTEYSMKNSPYKNGQGDIVRECSDACKKFGLKFGFYLSPWDRNSPYYGTDEYNTYYKNQLTELLTNYGDIFYVWFDGACGEGPNGKKQVYDFDGYVELIKKYQPGAAVFHDSGSIRWCGNEAGKAPHAMWAVVPSELCKMPAIQTSAGPLSGSLEFMYNSDTDIGTMPNILYSKGLVFAPAEVDMSIRDGWFWHENENPHSLERLFNTYISSVGNNSTFNLNVPPDRNGRIDERDMVRLRELGDKIRNSFGNCISDDAKIETSYPYGPSQPVITLSLPEKRHISFVEIAENIRTGQRVESFTIICDGQVSSTTIGSKKIIQLDKFSDKLVLRVNAARAVPEIEYVKLF